MKQNLLFHFRPRRVPVAAVRLSLTWGLGGIAALMVVGQLLSGLLLSFFYEPAPVHAYNSIIHIQNNVAMGQLLRNLHHWTGHGLMIIVSLHLLRVFMSDAYHDSRRGNWWVGLGLGLIILVANFSGYLLPWDQLSYWAVTIATSMLGYIPFIGLSLQNMLRGGTEVGGQTLHLFYTIHTAIIPIGLLILIPYHFWFIRKAGGLLVPRTEQKPTVPLDNLLTREMSCAAVVTCGLLLFAMFVNAPLADMANPQLTPDNVKAPWYFMGAQELLLHIPPIFAVVVIPLILSSFLILLPLMKNRKIIRPVFISGLLFICGLTLIGICFRGPAMMWSYPW